MTATLRAGDRVRPDPCAIVDVEWRQRVTIRGRVHAMRVQPWAGVATLEIVLRDGTAGISVVFLGRRHVVGIRLGSTVKVTGTVGLHQERLAILNPEFEVEAPEE